MKNVLLIALVFSSCAMFAQEKKVYTLEDLKNAPSGIGEDLSYMNKWEYFDLKVTIRARVLIDHPQITACGVVVTCSMTIVLMDNNEKIRVLDYCSSKKYNVGDMVIIKPSTVRGGGIPFNLMRPKPGEKWQPWPDDLTILKTTWGEISH